MPRPTDIDALSIATIRTLYIDAVQEQEQNYRDSVLPPEVTARVAIEQASTFGWERYTGLAGRTIGMRSFGASAPLKELLTKFGFTLEAAVAAAKEALCET